MTYEKTKIVLYDSKVFFRTLILDILEEQGFDVVVAESLKTLGSLLYELSPDMLLLDVSELKDRDTEFLLAIRKSFPTLPIISLVDIEKKELVVRYVRAGVFDCVSKPIIKEELIAAINKAKEFTHYKLEETKRIGRLKHFVHGSEKMLRLLKNKKLDIPISFPEDKLVQSILDTIAKVLEAEKVSVSWLSSDKKIYQVVASAGHSMDVKNFIPRAVGEGIVGYVAHNKEPINVTNIHDDPRFKTSSFKQQYKSNSFMCGPIIISDDVVAVLSVSDKKDGKAFTEEEFLLFKTFLTQTTYAIEGSLLIKLLEKNNTQLKIYKEIAEHITNLVETGDILKSILKTIANHFKALGVFVFILNENKEFFECECHYGLNVRDKVAYVSSLDTLLLRHHTEDDKNVIKFFEVFLKDEKFTKFYTVPIRLKNFPLGFLALVDYTVSYVDENIMEDVSALVSVAFKNNWLYKNLCIIADELVKTNRELDLTIKDKKNRECL